MTGHAGHIGSLLGPALLMVLLAGWSDLRAWARRRGDELAPTAALVAAVLSVGAAAIHAVVVPAHLSEDLLYGVFFAVVAGAQGSWAVVTVLQPHPRVLLAGLVGNLAVVSLWLVTRTAGIPVGAGARRTEPLGLLDTSCGALELGVVVCCALVLRSRRVALAA